MRNIKAKYYAYLFLGIMALLAILSSCITEKKRKKICQTCTIKETITVKDSSWQVKYDSLLKIPVKGPKIIMKDNPCALLCDSLGRVKDYQQTAVSETGIKGTIKGDSKTNTIVIDCGSKDSLQHLLNDARVENYHLRQEKKVEQLPARCDLEHRTWLDTTCKWICLILASGILIRYLVRRFWKQL